MRRFAALVLVLTVGHAHADRDTADRLAREAEALAAKHDYIAAAGKFRTAYSQDPRPDLMCNVGIAYYKALDLPRAFRYLTRCKDTSAQLDPAFVANVDKVLAAVRAQLATHDFKPVQLVVEPQSASTTIQGAPFDEPFVGNELAWVPFGHYTLLVHAEGYVDQLLELDARSRDPVTETARLAPVVAHPAPVPLPPPVVAKPAPAPVPPQPPPAAPARAESAGRTPAIAASAATVGVGALALGCYLVALDHADAANRAATLPDMTKYNQESSTARDWQYASWVAGGLAGAGAALSAYLWLRSPRSPHVEVRAGAGGGGVSLSGSW